MVLRTGLSQKMPATVSSMNWPGSRQHFQLRRSVPDLSEGGLVRHASFRFSAQHPGAAMIVQQIKMAGVGLANVHQSFQEPAQQFVQIARLPLYAEQLVKG